MAANMLEFRQSTAPWLMLPSCDNNTGNRCCCFYDVAEQQFHHHVDLPAAGNKTCRGSAFGWLFMVQQTPSVFLLNPQTGSQISLPPITTFPDVLAYRPAKRRREYLLRVDPNRSTTGQDKEYTEKHYLERVAMSAAPGEEECVVMVIRFNENYRLGFCKPNDETWTLIPHKGLIPFTDLVFWRGQFYALDQNGCLYVCDLSSPSEPKLARLVGLHCVLRQRSVVASHRYLVISPAGDELMMVTRDVCISPEHWDLLDGQRGAVKRYYNDGEEEEEEEEEEAVVDDIDEPIGAASNRTYWTSKFTVYKLRNEGGRKGWEEMESIGDFALFLGYNSTFVSTEKHPGLTPNSIYFTDNITDRHLWSRSNRRHGGHDMGIYNLTTGTIQPLYSAASVHKDPLLMHPPAVWISPPNI